MSSDTAQNGSGGGVNESAAMREALVEMNHNLTSIDEKFAVLNVQSARISAMGPTMKDTTVQIGELKGQLKSHAVSQNEAVKALRSQAQGEVAERLVAGAKNKIRERVKAEIERQVGEVVGVQMKEHLPVSLREQAEESKKLVEEVDKSLLNSRARKTNSSLPASDLDEPLRVVLKRNGEKGRYFPADLRSLFAYDDETMKALVREYEIGDSSERKTNLNRFMTHIGVGV